MKALNFLMSVALLTTTLSTFGQHRNCGFQANEEHRHGGKDGMHEHHSRLEHDIQEYLYKKKLQKSAPDLHTLMALALSLCARRPLVVTQASKSK